MLIYNEYSEILANVTLEVRETALRVTGTQFSQTSWTHSEKRQDMFPRFAEQHNSGGKKKTHVCLQAQKKKFVYEESEPEK